MVENRIKCGRFSIGFSPNFLSFPGFSLLQPIFSAWRVRTTFSWGSTPRSTSSSIAAAPPGGERRPSSFSERLVPKWDLCQVQNQLEELCHRQEGKPGEPSVEASLLDLRFVLLFSSLFFLLSYLFLLFVFVLPRRLRARMAIIEPSALDSCGCEHVCFFLKTFFVRSFCTLLPSSWISMTFLLKLPWNVIVKCWDWGWHLVTRPHKGQTLQ